MAKVFTTNDLTVPDTSDLKTGDARRRHNKKKKRRHLKKKRLWLPITIIVLLIVARLLLPYFVKNYVNKTLANIPGYYGQVEDIDIALWRGAYVIHGLYLNKLDGVKFNLFTDKWQISEDKSINYISIFKKI